MITRHLQSFGAELCKAYKEIASYKWGAAFRCTRPECGCDKYYEGETPYSRRCSKCKRDHSVTAHTVFDKLRMPMPTCLEIVRMVIATDHKMTVAELTGHLIDSNFKGANERSVWALAKKIYSTVEDKYEPDMCVYDKEAMFVTIEERHRIILVGRGISQEKEVYNVHILRGEALIEPTIKNTTTENTNVALFRFRGKYFSQTKGRPVNYRPVWNMDYKSSIPLVKSIVGWEREKTIYLYKKRGKTYDDLMKLLVAPPSVII